MVGQKVAHYQVTAKVGEGGMGVVYRATDGKLGREVALKVLPASVANDPERLARFEREARTLASVNHPHIAAIYGVEEGALVMELVEGTTLYDKLSGGALAEEEAIGIAKQIAEALEAAHEKGIIHRDLKPANVKITPEGVVKLLDFGLAKAIEGDAISGDLENSPTMTRQASMTGVILGTAGYMSPEQARGLKVDRRADIWAFGVVLYEMVTGRSLFDGETVADRMAAVLTKDPDIDRAPARVRPLLRRCLQRDPRKRLGWIGDARFEMDEVPAAVPQKARALWVIPAMAVALIAAAGVIAALLLRMPPAVERPVRRFTIAAPGLIDGPAPHVQISPDGKRIVYVSNNRLWVREMDREEATQLTDGEGASPFWSPDSRTVAFYRQGRLWKSGVDVAVPVPVCGTVGTFYGGSWSADGGRIVFGTSRGVHTIAASGGTAQLVLPASPDLGPSLIHPQYLPSGFGEDAILVAAGTLYEQRLFLVRLNSGEKLDLGAGNRPFYSPDGFVLFSRSAQLFAAAYSPSSPGTLGPQFPVSVEGTLASVARDGTMVVVTRNEGLETRLAVRDRQGKQIRVAGATQRAMRMLQVSPDGERAAVTSTEQGSADVWIHDLKRGVKSRLTFDPGTESYPKFSPDGLQVAYSSSRSGNTDILSQPADGSGEIATIASGPDGEFPTDWSADGNHLVLTRLPQSGTRGIWFVRRKPEGGWSDAVAFHNSAIDASGGRVSPNGRFLAYRSYESGESAIYVRPFPSGPGKWQVTAGGTIQPRWSRDGREIYFLADDVLMATKVNSEGAFSVGATERLFALGGYDVSDVSTKFDTLPGGAFLVIEPLESQALRPQVIHVVENWLEAFRKAR